MEEEHPDEFALRVSNAYKSHGTNKVLRGLNMNVPKSSIYALLGPSGCGKTTLLNCIVGMMKMESGSIYISTKDKSQLGFMPQNLSLYILLTIKETFKYYGRLHGLTSRQIEEREEDISKLLELPNTNRVVDTLSGGQQRRVSLAVALINNPKLLILDEPTVGLDPVLSHCIWQYLLRLSNVQNKAIIITTHYIEEARQAHMVGLMRAGILLCEDTPAEIMSSQGCDTMEKAFLQLSHVQQNNMTYCDEIFNRRRASCLNQTSQILQGSPILSWSGFNAEFIKNFIFLWRNKPMLLFLFGLPIVVSFLFNIAIGHNPVGLKIGIVNNELQYGLSECDRPWIGCNFSFPISCRYLNKLRETEIKLVHFQSVEDARRASLKNYVWGYMNISSDYTESLQERFSENLLTSETSAAGSVVNIWLDMSNQNIGNLIKLQLLQSFVEFLRELASDCGWAPEALRSPIRINEPVYGDREPNFNHFASPAIIIVMIFYLPMSYTIGVIVQEKLTGVLERSMIAGVSLLDIFLSQAVIQVVLMIIQLGLMMFILYFIYETPFLGNPFWTSVLLILQGISGLAFGILIAVMFDKILNATYASLGSLFSFFFLSGMVWPQEGLFFVLKWFRFLVPVSYSVEALRGLSARGWGISHPVVYQGFISLVSWIILFCLGAHIVLKLRHGIVVK